MVGELAAWWAPAYQTDENSLLATASDEKSRFLVSMAHKWQPKVKVAKVNMRVVENRTALLSTGWLQIICFVLFFVFFSCSVLCSLPFVAQLNSCQRCFHRIYPLISSPCFSSMMGLLDWSHLSQSFTAGARDETIIMSPQMGISASKCAKHNTHIN